MFNILENTVPEYVDEIKYVTISLITLLFLNLSSIKNFCMKNIVKILK